jgi:hypothetical protein
MSSTTPGPDSDVPQELLSVLDSEEESALGAAAAVQNASAELEFDLDDLLLAFCEKKVELDHLRLPRNVREYLYTLADNLDSDMDVNVEHIINKVEILSRDDVFDRAERIYRHEDLSIQLKKEKLANLISRAEALHYEVSKHQVVSHLRNLDAEHGGQQDGLTPREDSDRDTLSKQDLRAEKTSTATPLNTDEDGVSGESPNDGGQQEEGHHKHRDQIEKKDEYTQATLEVEPDRSRKGQDSSTEDVELGDEPGSGAEPHQSVDPSDGQMDNVERADVGSASSPSQSSPEPTLNNLSERTQISVNGWDGSENSNSNRGVLISVATDPTRLPSVTDDPPSKQSLFELQEQFDMLSRVFTLLHINQDVVDPSAGVQLEKRLEQVSEELRSRGCSVQQSIAEAVTDSPAGGSRNEQSDKE